MEGVTTLPMSELREPEIHIRQTINMEKVRELAESIREQGLLQPILVRPIDGKYEIVAGHRRYLAHRMLGQDTIKAIVKDLSFEETYITRATENLQREDLTPMEEAKIYGMLHNKLRMSYEAIAQKMGKSRRTIVRYIDLLDLPETYQKAIDAGMISLSVVEILNKIDNAEIRDYYFDNAIQNGCSARTAQLWVDDYEATKAARYYLAPNAPDDKKVPYEAKPAFYACDACLEPVEISQVKHVIACPKCVAAIKSGALRK